MKFSSSALALALAAAASAAPADCLNKRAQTWCDAWGSTTAGPYVIYHNNWGAGQATSGQQCTTFNSISGNNVKWSTSWSWTGGPNSVKAYPNVALEKVNKQLSAVKSIPSTWTWDYTGSNVVANVAYDLWLAPSQGANDQYEIMIWLGTLGGAGPISSNYGADGKPVPVGSATVEGVKYDIYKGNNGVDVFSFLPASNNKNYSGDLNAFFKELTKNHGVSTSSWITHLQGGTEPFTGSNAVMTTSSFTMSVN